MCRYTVYRNIVQNVFSEQKYLADEKSKLKKALLSRFNGLTLEIFDEFLNEFFDGELSTVAKVEFKYVRLKLFVVHIIETMISLYFFQNRKTEL